MREIIKEKGLNKEVVLRLDEGDELFEVLRKYAAENRILGAKFTAIGACSSIKITFYCPQEKKYIPTEAEGEPITEDLEVTGIIGNIGWMDNNPVIHAHGTFSKKDFSVIGGHIFSVTASATLEVMITIYEGEITRAKNEDWNLNLMIKN
ncbi:DNA-binding protein [bacterium]|nr:MAG: DNA-binding protein [bacterium]